MSKDKSLQNKELYFSVFDLWRLVSSSPIPDVEYDDIVDDSDFRPTAEQIRDNEFRSNGSAIDPDSLQYDYDAGKVIKEKVSDVVLLLRNGKLDKADVQVLNEALTNKLEKSAQDKKNADVLASEERAAKNRTAALDKALGVDQDSNKCIVCADIELLKSLRLSNNPTSVLNQNC